MTEQSVRAYLKETNIVGRELRCFAEIGSTNDYLKTERDLPDGTVVTAEAQSAGRGRRGRSFESAAGVGIYLSALLKPALSPDRLMPLTGLAAVAAVNAIERVCGLSADIKWVNDVYYGGKKLGGILTEGALSEDMRTAKYVIVGIGLNVRRTDMPEELRDIALSIEEACGKACDRNLLIAEIISEFMGGLASLGSPEIHDEYKRRCFLIGREVTVHRLDRSYPALVTDVTEDMSLLLRLSDGNAEKLNTGEVSVREK
jgi:BirA family biotin operon repressor/biotin-[acetyl-CoA-carboxylase] ligase